MKSEKKTLKLKVLGLFRLETEGLKIREILLIIGIIMLFIFTLVLLLKAFAIPATSISGMIH